LPVVKLPNVLGYLKSDPRLLAFGFLVTFSSSFGQTFFISLFSADIRAALDLNNAGFGAAYSIGTLSSALVLTWSGHWIDRVDLRTWTIALITLFGIACLSMAVSQNFLMLVGAIFLLRQTGQGLMTHTSMTSQARYHDTARGKAVATAGLGFPLAEACFPILGVAVLGALDWRLSWTAFAVFLLFILLPLCLWLLRGHGERHARYLAGAGKLLETEPGEDPATRVHWTRKQVLGDYRFYLLLPVTLAPSFIFTGIFFHQIVIVEAKGWQLEVWAAAYAAFAATSVLAGLAFGAYIDKVGAPRSIPWLLPPLGLGCLLMAVTDSLLAAWGYMILAGLTAGMISTFFGAFWADVYGTRYLGSIRALATALMVLSSALSPVIMGVLLDDGIKIEPMAMAFFLYTMAATGLAVFVRRSFLRPRPDQ